MSSGCACWPSRAVAGTRAEAETTRAALRATGTETAERLATLRGAMDTGVEQVRTTLSREQGELRLALAEGQAKTATAIGAQFDGTRTLLEAKLKEMREGNEGKLAEIQKTVNEQLNAAVEKQMQTSFARVIDQFTAVQKAMGDVQAVTAQIGDIKRLFSNVKTRGGWGETQVRAMLDDMLPAGAYRNQSQDPRRTATTWWSSSCMMPMRGEVAAAAADRREIPGRGLRAPAGRRPMPAMSRPSALRGAGWSGASATRRRRSQAKYIHPPVTVEFAVLYLPTDCAVCRGRAHPRADRRHRPRAAACW